MALNQKEYVDELRVEWKRLWNERLDDKVRAEGIAINDYSSLFVDQGTIIHATRDFKILNFKDILKQHEVENAERYIQPDKHVGGWNKFVKDNVVKQPSKRKTVDKFLVKQQKEKLQQKKNGRGWLHI
ncbi:MAG TPA: hypothetical protein VLH35_00600 [Candidatus Acidoferrales bacterium]|nr:hypothetical protein [Candidatus Acidoferrales bacterium]